MTATEASRAFSALLDAVESGETVVIERGGRRVAVVTAATTTNGRQVKELLAWARADGAFADDMQSLRRLVVDGRSWPDDDSS